MAGQKPPRGLDDGPPLSKKRKGNAPSITHITSSDQPKPSINVPEILPFEPLSSFSARVDAALPISGLSRSKGKVDPVDGKARQTKLEKRMQKMQQEWREADQRRKAQAADDEADSDDWSSRAKVPGKRNPRGKLKRRTTTAGEKEDDDDPWSVLTTKRLETSLPATSAPSSGLVGLHDVVLAPPKLKIPRETMKKRLHGGGAGKGVLGGATGMRRQAELGEEAIKVVEGYRRMMAGKTEG